MRTQTPWKANSGILKLVKKVSEDCFKAEMQSEWILYLEQNNSS